MKLKKVPLGYVTVNSEKVHNKKLPVYRMTDIFTNYAFDKKENWVYLKNIVNVFLEEYNKTAKNKIELITDDVEVETQIEHYKNLETLKPKKRQDFELKEKYHKKFLELQNRKDTKPILIIRSLQYLGIPLSNLKDENDNTKSVTQIWILGQNQLDVSKNKAITNFELVDSETKESYPIKTNMLFITLPICVKELEGEAKELASFLMDYETELTYKGTKELANMLEKELENFRQEKGLVNMMSILEERDALVTDAMQRLNEANKRVEAEAKRAEVEAKRAEAEAKRVSKAEKEIEELKKQIALLQNSEKQKNE